MEDDEFYIDYGKLDMLQRQYVDKKVNKSMVICGAAGSGKSVIALHKAKQVSALGSYAIVIYTKTLEKYFDNGLQKLGLTNVYHYHKWNGQKVKYLIVDECQDFSKEEIEELKESAEICFFFGDTAQSIMNFRTDKETGERIKLQSVQDTALSMNVTMLPLQKNYRLTKQIAEVAEKVGKVEDLVDDCVREGEKPEAIEKQSIDEQLDEIIRLKKNNSLSSVGILLPFNTENTAIKGAKYVGIETEANKFSVEYVKNYFIKKGEPVEYKYSDSQVSELELDFHTTNVKVMTWWCAKGLQFKDVFILNCQADYNEDKRSALYVAVTRCSERLHLLYTGELSSKYFPDKGSGLYKKEMDLSEFEF